MDAETEQRLLATLYDRLFDILTYAPKVAGAAVPPGLERARTMVHLSKNQVVNPKQFANAASPSNPEGSLAQAEAFSAMVDQVPLAQTEYRSRPGRTVSTAYTQIANGANSLLEPDPKQLKLFEQADAYLNTHRETKDLKGNIRKTPIPTEVFSQYLTLRTAFHTAVGKYRGTLASHDMTDPKEQQLWQAEAPALEAAVQSTYDTWRNADADLVEEALAVKASTINNAVRKAIKDAQDRTSQPLASNVVGGAKWLLSYALPDAWTSSDVAPSFSEFTLSSSNLNTSKGTEFTSYGGGASWGVGLWSVGGGFSSSELSVHSHMDSAKFELRCKIGVIQVIRPWFDSFLFGLDAWSMNGVGPAGIAKGNLDGVDDCLLPLIPTAFVVARDIEITSGLSNVDQTYVEKHLAASASIGWGPFSVSGRYSHDETHETYQAHFEGGKLVLPGIQVIAWVTSVLPFSPKK